MARLSEAFNLPLTQSEVDFVVPDLASDLPLCIDPFLLYKSKDPVLRKLHDRLLGIFDLGIQLYREGRRDELDYLIDFPEVDEIGFGYTEGGIGGHGLGTRLNTLLAELLAGSEALQERGLRHVEDLQLLSIGVSHDRVSDIAANVLKSFLIDYTRQQAELWDIPFTPGIPVSHYFDFDANEWADGYFDLPRNPIGGRPILLVPRRIVRLLPWINYDDYARTDFRLFLQPRRGPRRPAYPGKPRTERADPPKQEVVQITRARLDLLDGYVARKEREGAAAEPALGIDQASIEAEHRLGDDFIARLQRLPTGTRAAADYQRLVFEIVNHLFEPDLVDGQLEVGTFLGTERRDIIYTNEADSSFWAYVRSTYKSLLVMFEVKNVTELELNHVNQTASYLGVRLGMLGFIVTRRPPGENIVRKTYTVYNDTPGEPRKTIIVLSDENLVAMIREKQESKLPAKYVQSLYRTFRQRIQ